MGKAKNRQTDISDDLSSSFFTADQIERARRLREKQHRLLADRLVRSLIGKSGLV